MKKTLKMVLLAAVIAVAVASCSDRPKVIPARKMEKIYREMFMADQWIIKNPEKKRKADTTWLYVPIFEKYGYSVEDYRHSVDHYLNDPKRYAEMLERVRKSLAKEYGPLNRKLVKAAEARHRADSLAQAHKIFSADDFINLYDLTYVTQMTDRIDFKRNKRGVWYPEPVVEDTVFRGPELIIKDTSSVEVEEHDPTEDLRIWRR
jgi:hypothetical protein